MRIFVPELAKKRDRVASQTKSVARLVRGTETELKGGESAFKEGRHKKIRRIPEKTRAMWEEWKKLLTIIVVYAGPREMPRPPCPAPERSEARYHAIGFVYAAQF
jgi:hypothetical protein